MLSFLSRGYRPFWTAFFLSLLVLGGALSICCAMVFSQTEQTDETNASASVRAGESFSVLLIGCESKNDQPQRVVLLRFCGLDSTLHISQVDLSQSVTVRLYTDTLAGQYAYGGPGQLLTAAREILGVSPDGWVRLDRAGLYTLAQQFPLAQIDLPEAFTTERYRFPAGLSSADAPRQADLFFSAEKSGGLQLVRQQMSELLKLSTDEAASLLLSCTDSSLSAYELACHSALFESMEQIVFDRG